VSSFLTAHQHKSLLVKRTIYSGKWYGIVVFNVQLDTL